MIVIEKKIEIYEKGLDKYPKSSAIIGNIVMLLWFALGTIACWYFYPMVAWAYLAFAVIMVYIVLRKLLCINCFYYGKLCGIGWGKLAAALFKQGKIEDFNKGAGQKLPPLTYGVLMIVPLILIIYSIIQVFTYYKIIVLALLLLVAIYSAGIRRKPTCSKCKMKLVCPGCAAK